MFRKIILFCLTLVLLVATTTPAEAAKSYYAERFDVEVEILRGGALIVRENVVFRFEGGPFTYAFRDLSYNNLDSIDQLQVFMDGELLSQGTGPGQVEIQAGNPLKVTWHFAPTSDSSHVFSLEYRVQGATRQDSQGDLIIWRAIPETHEYQIRAAEIRLFLPEDSRLVTPPTITTGQDTREETPGQWVFRVGEISENQPVDITAVFPAGSLISQPPAWQVAAMQKQADLRQLYLVVLGSALVTLVVGALGLWVFAQRLQQEKYTPPNRTLKLASTPHPALAPGLAAYLTGNTTPALATIFDLAKRGVLVIERDHGFLGRKVYRLVRQPGQISLAPHEESLLEILFTRRKGEKKESISFDEVSTQIASGSRKFTAALESELQALGWFDPARKKQKNAYSILALLALLLSLFLGGFGLAWLSMRSGFGINSELVVTAIMAGVGAAGFVLSLAFFIVAVKVPVFTNAGQEQAARWKSFQQYLKDVSRGKEPALRPDAFDLYLALAAGFGIATQWTKYFEKMEGAQVPAWFRTLDGKLLNFSDVYSVVVASDSSAGGAAGAAGAAGASGGGASGAG